MVTCSILVVGILPFDEQLIAFHVKFFIAPHSLNANPPMEVTELGMVTEVSPLQPENALLPMDVTELGMGTSVRPLI